MFNVMVTSWHRGGSGETNKSLSGAARLLADPPTSQAASCFACFPLKTPTKSTYFNRAFQFYQLRNSLPAESCLIGRFPNGSVMPDNYSYKYFYYGIPQYRSVERHKDKEQNRGQRPLLLDSTYTVCERYLQAPEQMTCGSLEVQGKEGQRILERWEASLQTRGKQENGLFSWLHRMPCTDVKVRDAVFYGTTRGMFRALNLGTQPSWLSYLPCLLKLP